MEDRSLADMAKLDNACQELAISTPQLLHVDGFRWTLREYPGLGPSMIKLERLLHKQTGRPIDLRLEVISDGNKRKEMAVRRSEPSK